MKRNQDDEMPLIKRPGGLGNEVYDVLYGQLMSLKIPPGDKLSVDSLSRALGVSQTPIREALSRLEAQGLVYKTHLIGYRAAEQLTRAKFEELYELRLLLEPFAAGRVAQERAPEVVGELRTLHEGMKGEGSASSRAAYGEFAKRDAAFHSFIAKSCGNELVFESFQRVHTHVHLYRLLFHSRATSDANDEHSRIVSAIAAGDVLEAQAAMKDHIQGSRQRFLDAFVDE